jgi:hypothetical protein
MRFIAIASVSCASARDRAVRHRAGGEALDDLLRRLDLVERRGLGGVGQPDQRRLQPRRPLDRRERAVEPRVAPQHLGAAHQRVEPRRRQQERVELDAARGLGAFREQGFEHAEPRPQRHHRALAQVVDRGVGDLREPLLEVRRHRTVRARHDGERGVVAHRRDGLLAGRAHRAQDGRELLAGVAVRRLPQRQRRSRLGDRLARGDAAQAVAQPFAVRPTRREPRLDVVVGLEAPARVDADHLAGPEAPPGDGPGEVHDAGLGRADDEPVARHRIAEGTEAVAVEARADALAVGEDETRRTVPRLGQPRVVLVEVAHGRQQVPRLLPRLRHEHRHDVAYVAARAHQQLDGVVEHRRVGAVGLDDGTDELLVDQVAGAERALARGHPVDVALDGVDLAVVAEEAERLRARPRRCGVGRVALVEHRERRRQRLVGEVAVERAELLGGAQRLVGDRTERHRREVRGDAAGGDRAREALARAEGTAFGLVHRHRRRPQQDRLLDARRLLAGELAQGPGRDRHDAPARDADALVQARVLQRPAGRGLHRLAALDVGRQERHREADQLLVAGLEVVGVRGEVRVVDRQQQPRAVARLRVVRDRAAVLDPAERGQRARHRLVRTPPAHVGDEADAAGVAFGVEEEWARPGPSCRGEARW